MCGIGLKISPIAVAAAEEQIGRAEFLHFGLERAESETALTGEFAQMQFPACFGIKKTQDLGSHMGKYDLKQTHVWLKHTIVWLNQSI